MDNGICVFKQYSFLVNATQTKINHNTSSVCMKLSNYFTHFMSTSLMVTFLGDYFMLQYSTSFFIPKDFESQASSTIWCPAFSLSGRAFPRDHYFYLPPPKKKNYLNTRPFLLEESTSITNITN